VYNFIMKFLAVNHPLLVENDRSTSTVCRTWYSKWSPNWQSNTSIAVPSSGAWLYMSQFCSLPYHCVNVYMEGGNVRIFSAWMEVYLILLFNVLL
jgi:hypothetical protein